MILFVKCEQWLITSTERKKTMPTPFIMPKMDMDQETVVINEWLKNEGDQVEKGEPVIVVETDKITSEVEAPASGRLARILYKNNEEMPVTKVVAYILEEGETEADLPQLSEKPEQNVEKRVKQDMSEPASEKTRKSATPIAMRMAKAENVELDLVPAEGDKITKDDVTAYLEKIDRVEPRVKVPATSAARRLASEADVSLDQVQGTGPRGRVQAKDVKEFSARVSVPQAPPRVELSAGETLPVSNIRRRIADRLTTSYQSTPHIYLTVEVDMHEAEESRKRMNQLVGAPPISITAYLVRLVAWALKRHPLLNATLEEDQIKLWEEVNIGIATALDEGLIVPVVHNADQHATQEINIIMRDLAEKARAGELTREEIQGGTFTITNLGMYGVDSFTAIINPPQSAILAVGAVRRKPTVVDDEDTVEVRPMMMMTLGADHRVVDGAVAAAFLADLVKAVETPELLLI
jgi:pyruvate dehydrogenase E2 component (dihydrolipoamide acetyltransferase)